MKRVPEVLQLAVIIEWRRAASFELSPLEKLNFILSGIGAEGSIFKEFLEARLRLGSRFGFRFQKLKFLIAIQGEPAVQDNLHAQILEVNVPALDQRLEQRHTTSCRPP